MKMKSVFLFLLVPLFLFFSCGKKDQQTTVTEQKDVQKDVTTQGDVQKKEEQKTTSKSNELGIEEGLPSDFPADVPKPKNADSLGTIKSSDETSVRFFTADLPKALADYYAQGLEKNGYKKTEGESLKDDGGMVIWKKDKKEVTLMMARDKEKNRTAVVLSYK
jgi:outer membrane lipoprotein-sorting protein